jgi:hypothetical protein
MNNQLVTVQDVLNSASAFNEDSVLTWDPAVYKDNMQNNKGKKGTFDCTWIPIKFKFANGTETALRLKFGKVMIASGAKLPSYTSDKDVPKYLNIAFKKMTIEEIATGDNVAKKMATPEEQEIADEKMKKHVQSVYTNTNEFVKALEIIDKSYKKVCQEMKAAKSLGFQIKKDKNIKKIEDVPMHSITQRFREDKENIGEEIALEDPITRLRLNLCKDGSGLVSDSIYDKDKKCWIPKPNVFDLRKMAANDNAAVLAKVKVDGRLCPLDKDNASKFITYKSITAGTVHFDENVASKFGLSLSNYFKVLYVKRNKTESKNTELSKEELADMGCEAESGDDEDVEMSSKIEEEPLVKKMAKTKITPIIPKVDSDLEDNYDYGSELDD